MHAIVRAAAAIGASNETKRKGSLMAEETWDTLELEGWVMNDQTLYNELRGFDDADELRAAARQYEEWFIDVDFGEVDWDYLIAELREEE
jgi:hypothetical protein